MVSAHLGRPGEANRVSIHGTCYFFSVKAVLLMLS